ncbi:ADP-ribosylation factor-like protein 9 [Astatotilapia calliptera]|uniref:ADP-ribosylation factor-like protein 9 n=1 Tax=Astatotilapia calliptera TaxID=8154 RepID=UPI000E40C586|nr:ADP-ribosylation factor-like protein 9 [Astatotilapia calliptera]
MLSLSRAGIVGASVAVAGGVAFLIWNYASSSGEEKPETRLGEVGESDREQREGEKDEIREEETPVIKAQQQQTQCAEPTTAVVEPVAAAEVRNTSQSQPVKSKGTQVLVLGLDGSGKTSLLQSLSTGRLEQDIQPTQGFNAVSINKDDCYIEFLEIGGKEDLRPYWQKYIPKALLLVFVVDSSNPQLFPVAKKHLHELLASRPSLPLMVLANKQDLPGSCGITDLHDALSLSELGDRRLFLIATHVKEGETELSSGVQDAQALISQLVCDGL